MSRKHVSDSLFRDYVRHYLMHGPPPTLDDDNELPTPSPSTIFATPTKASRSAPTDETPRQPKRRHPGFPPSTPTPRLRIQGHEAESADSMLGFTLSHLRRVPELALLADKLYRKNCDDYRKAGKTSTGRPSTSTKGLFEKAVNSLLQRSTVVLWDGPVHPLPEPSLHYADTMWRMSSSRSQAQTNVSGVSTASVASQCDVGDLIGELSDPPSEEESYVPLTTEYLARHVYLVLKRLTNPDPAGAALPGLRQFRKRGPTAQRIAQALQSADERWKDTSEWNVREALRLLEDQGCVWKSSEQEGGLWELTL
jgi:hypothetical protein